MRQDNSIMGTFHYALFIFFPVLPPLVSLSILLYPLCALNPLQSTLFFLSSASPSLPPLGYLHSIRRRVQSASLGDLQRRQEEQSGTKQHRTQHGSRVTDREILARGH